MNFTTLDWSIVALMAAGLFGIAFYVKRYTRSVADFLAANRVGGRYLLTIADGMAGIGAISIVANWEKFYAAGFGAAFWGEMLAPIWLFMAITGWVVYRFRETRALTLAQFFEMRYSRNFRLFAGSLCWLAGILNYGIFPAINSRFVIYFTGLPEWAWAVPGLGLEVSLMQALISFLLLALALWISLAGGQIAIMVTDFVQGQLMNLVLVGVLILLLVTFQWETIIQTLETHAPAGESMIDPFDQDNLGDFNWTFFAMMAVMNLYSQMAWQGNQGYYAAAKTPHEAKMARILAAWRTTTLWLLGLLIPVCIFVVMHDAGYAGLADATREQLSGLDDPTLVQQMTVPAGLSQVLPVGLAGLFLGVMLASAVSTDDTYLHSWGSILVQDVVAPLKKKPLSQKQRLRMLRFSIFGVAVFAWVFSLVFPLREYIVMYQQITGAIFMGGAGAVIIGGLYWDRGTTAGAWAALVSGSFLALSSIFLINYGFPTLVPQLKAAYPESPFLQGLPEEFWFNGMQSSFSTAIVASSLYVVVSLLTSRGRFPLARLLHRDAASRAEDGLGAGPPAVGMKMTLKERLGVTSDFTLGDKLIYGAQVGWSMFFFLTFLALIGLHFLTDMTTERWALWWWIRVYFIVVVGLVTTVWFLIGGVRDLLSLKHDLQNARQDEADDGSVSRADFLDGRIATPAQKADPADNTYEA